MTVILVQALAQTLVKGSLESIQGLARLELMLWVLFSGLQSSCDDTCSKIFSKMLPDLVSRLAISSWKRTARILRRFFYWEKVHAQPYLDIWNEIGNLRDL